MIVSEDNKEYTLKVSGNPAQMQAEDFILYIQSNVNVNDYGENGADGDDGIQSAVEVWFYTSDADGMDEVRELMNQNVLALIFVA